MGTAEFVITLYALLWGIGLTALLTWANYKANFIFKDGKTVINWNSVNEGKPEFFIFLASLVFSIIALIYLIAGGD